MARSFESVPASVVIDYTAQDHLTTAHFNWDEGKAADTYTIAVNSGLSVGLDAHLPVRPDFINLYDKSRGNLKPLEKLVGAELTEAMAEAKRYGTVALSIELSVENRLAIAHLQFHSPSTPPRVRDAVAVLLDSYDANPRLASHRHLVERAHPSDQMTA